MKLYVIVEFLTNGIGRVTKSVKAIFSIKEIADNYVILHNVNPMVSFEICEIFYRDGMVFDDLLNDFYPRTHK